MHAKLPFVGVLVCVFAVEASAQVPRPPGKDLTLQARKFTIPFPGWSQPSANRIAFSKDGALLATGAGANIVVWDVETTKSSRKCSSARSNTPSTSPSPTTARRSCPAATTIR